MKSFVEVVTISSEIMDRIDRPHADKLGMTLEEYRAMLKKSADDHWCSCKNELGRVTYHEDGVMVNDHCTHKHHWHCLNCHKLTQVG